MRPSLRLCAVAATVVLLHEASAADGFLCPVPVIPADLGPSNACCSKLIELPLTELLNPVDGAVYWGVNCTKAVVKENVGDGSDQAITFPCEEDFSNACCDPTVRKFFGSGPCTLPESK